MMGRDAVIRLAHEEGLGDQAEELARTVRPGWRLDLDPNADPGRPGASKIGGDPDLAEEEARPESPRGIAMTFLAQIDCSALPAIDSAGWRHGRHLVRLFADLVANAGPPLRPGDPRRGGIHGARARYDRLVCSVDSC